MRSKILQDIIDKTPQEVNDKVDDYADKLVLDNFNKKREKLLAYHRYLVEELNMNLEEIWVDEFLKANNCA